MVRMMATSISFNLRFHLCHINHKPFLTMN